MKLKSKTWRILHPGECIDAGDKMNSKDNPNTDECPDNNPTGGWIETNEYLIGKTVTVKDNLWFATKIKSRSNQ